MGYDALKVLHVVTVVFMSVPLFNLIVVNERAAMDASFNYATDRFFENIIGHGARRCFVFQVTVAITGLLLLIYGPFGISALWTNWVVLTKVLLLIVLTAILSYVHTRLQPKIESLMAPAKPDAPPPEGLTAQLKPYRALRKKLAALCLFFVLTLVVLGLQVYTSFHPALTAGLIALAALFAWRAFRSPLHFGWI